MNYPELTNLQFLELGSGHCGSLSNPKVSTFYKMLETDVDCKSIEVGVRNWIIESFNAWWFEFFHL
jgi:hypothetical protein